MREECGHSISSALLNADLICPDPIARQLLVMDEASPEKAYNGGLNQGSRSGFRDLRHVFVPVNVTNSMDL